MFETLDLRRHNAQPTSAAPAAFRRAQIGAEIEEIVLNTAEYVVSLSVGVKPSDTDSGIGLVDGAVAATRNEYLGTHAIAGRFLRRHRRSIDRFNLTIAVSPLMPGKQHQYSQQHER